mmetsp:Transcript_19731/g.27807  ORF Transcript_19731/g.27807 Transcript_19731/m.27807 type:complete len:194 (+) Transcript_19731:73-654(+)|eukprot:CAMPEP_0171453962 /NCGR_PEP_ID=MMETSP0945-20130129/1446_1 /TAXON_ID=109269 /ORGANISM="Vaucheria litorea, Strain CCMP2940" /LENGTH=193 /DNA_ID=CAMNT_0011978905 /DNA_START=77 /DNA_END=658 /DNA_ORIENTATION=-
MAVIESFGKYVSTWWFGIIIVVLLTLAQSKYFSFESPRERRERIRENRKSFLKKNKDEEDLIDSVLKEVGKKNEKAEKPKAEPKATQKSASKDSQEIPLKWTQNKEEVDITLEVPKDVAKSDIKFQLLKGNRLTLAIRSSVLIQGELLHPVDSDASTWQIEDQGNKRVVWIQLTKIIMSKECEFWKALLKTKP